MTSGVKDKFSNHKISLPTSIDELGALKKHGWLIQRYFLHSGAQSKFPSRYTGNLYIKVFFTFNGGKQKVKHMSHWVNKVV